MSGCSDDASAVSVLPYHWSPRKGGSILAKYLKKREDDHFKVLKDLQEATSGVNEEIESKVRILAENLLCEINNNQHEIDCVIAEQDLIEGAPPAENHNDVLNKIESAISERLQEISDFKEEALRLENERANGLRKVLHDHFGRLVAVHHEPPKELFRKFDEKIYEINKQLLSNCAAYNELEEQLRAKANQSQIKARSYINQLRLGVVINNRGRSAIQCDKKEININKRSKSAKESIKAISSAKLSLTDTVELDECINRFSEEYRNAITNTYEAFLKELSELHKQIGVESYIQKQICCANEISILERKLTKSFSRLSEVNFQSAMTINRDLSELVDCIKMMQKSLLAVGNQLKDTYTLLHEASHLWDAHMIRLALAQKLTMAAVEDLATRHDSVEQASDVPFNIALEQLMTASDVDKLQQHYEALDVLLTRKSEEYVQHGDIEMSRLEEFIKLREPLTNILQAEFDLFISKYPIASYGSAEDEGEGSVRETHPRIHTLNMRLQTSIARDIFQTEVEEIALKNWRNGFLESFRNSLPLLSEKLENQVRSWIDERSVPLKKRHSFKTLSLEVRKERIAVARDLRLAQLRNHENCFESHLGAINELATALPTEVSQLLTFDTPGLYPIREWAERIRTGMDELKETSVDDEVKRLKMMSYATRLANHRRLFEESSVSIVESTKKLIGQRVQIARISNIRFVSHLKLFSEGGNHSATEAAKMCAALVKADDIVEGCVGRALDALNHRRVDLLSQADQLIHPLKTIAEDVIKETGKGLENVQLLDKYNVRNPSKGTLYFATTHLIFVDHEMRKETWILLMHISSVERLPITTTGSPLLVRTKTFQSVFFVIPRERDCHEMHQTLLRLSQPVHIEELYCFHYKSTPDDLPKSAGWNFFDIQTEYQRMNVPNEHWVLCNGNKDYELCDTYPSEVYVPARASTAVLVGSASFRSRGRLPVLAYLHHNGAAIARCSQPLSGFSASGFSAR
ncbi:unnamed protein product, partial [Iphiclides podalirius]